MIFLQKFTGVLTLLLLHCIPGGTQCVKSKHALRSFYMHTFNEAAVAKTVYLTLVKEVSPNIAKCVHECALMNNCVAAEWREEDRTFCRYLQSDRPVYLPQLLEPDALSIITFDGMSELIVVECPVTWTEFKGSCYKYFADSVEFTKARASCKEQGADLLTFETKEEQDFVVQNFGFTQAWISLTKNDAGEWKWGDGSDPLFMLWDTANNEPQAGEECARVINGKWWGASCGSGVTFKYACEMKPTEY